MTMRLDVLTNDAGELVRRENARDLGSGVVVAIYRLMKLVQMHDLGNQAFVRQLEQTHELITDYCLRAGGNVNVLFADRAIFVAGQLLKGSRLTYESARELGAILEASGAAEITVQRDVTKDDLRAFAEAFSSSLRGGKQRSFRSPSPRIKLRAVNAAARRGLEVEKLDDELRIVRTYASAVVVMRRFFEDLGEGKYVLPRRIKRIAQGLVDLSEGARPAFLGVTEARNANHDEAGRAVNTAILAVAMAREVTTDRGMLAQIAMAALMHDVARPRAAALARGTGGPAITGIVARLTEQAEDRMAPGAAAVLTALGRMNEPTVRRTVVAFEALWLRRERYIGPLYRGVRKPTLHARIVFVARRYNDLVTPEPGLPEMAPAAGVATLASELVDAADRTAVRMLVAALGLVPVGTVVALENGEAAEIIAPSRMRLVVSADGGVYDRVLEVDVPSTGPRAIARVLGIEGWGRGPEARGAAPPSFVSSPSISRDDVMPDEDAWRTPSTSRVVPLAPSASDVIVPTAVMGFAEELTREHFNFRATMGTSPNLVADAFEQALTPMPEAPEPSEADARAVAAAASGATSERTLLYRPGAAAAGTVVTSTDGPQPPAPTTDAPEGAAPASTSQSLEPAARGSLAQTPLLHMLVYMLDRSLTGSVVFFDPNGEENTIYFERGTPTRVKTAQAIALLGEELIAGGAVAPDIVRLAASGAQRLGLLLGEYLVGYDFISREALDEALRGQISRKIATLANLSPNTSFAFFKDVNLLESWGGGDFTPCDGLSLVLACARTWHDRARMHATLGRIRTQLLVLHPNAFVDQLVLTPDEARVLDAIRAGAITLHDLVNTRVADEEVVSALVYTLAVTRQLDLPGQKGGPMAAAEGAPGDGSGGTGRVSLFGARPSFTEMPRPVDAVGEAAESLAADDLEDAPEDVERAERALKAMTDFRLAETAVDRGDLRAAEEHVGNAAKGDPGRPEYAAFLVWVRSMGGKITIPEALAGLTEIITREPRCERALLYRGRLHKRVQRNNVALTDFQAILALNPHHREAASEVRLLRNKKSVRP